MPRIDQNFTPVANDYAVDSEQEVEEGGVCRADATTSREESAVSDSIEEAEAQVCEEPETSETTAHAEGPQVSAHLLHATGGRSGHQALEGHEKESPAPPRAKEGGKYEKRATETVARNGFRDRNAVSNSRTLRGKSYERQNNGLDPKKTSLAEEKFSRVSHGRIGNDVSGTVWKEEVHGEASLIQLAKGPHGTIALFEATGHAEAKLVMKEGKVALNFGAGGALNLVDAHYRRELTEGPVKLQGGGYATVGASVDGRGELAMNPLAGKMKIAGGGSAFVGARAGVDASVGAAGIKLGSRVQVEAGIGAEATGTIDFDHGKITINGDVGLCLGVGADARVNVEVDIPELAEKAGEAGEYAAEQLQAAANEAAKAAESIALEAADDLAKQALSFLDSARDAVQDVQTVVEGVQAARRE